MGYVDMDALWSYLDPSDAALAELHKELMSKYQEDLARFSQVDLGSDSREDRNAFQRVLHAFNQSTHQKLRLAAALISLNAWRPASRVLLSLTRLCKPVLNHHVRSALCDLLKWLIEPLLKATIRKLPQQEKPTLENTFRNVRCFTFGLELERNEGGEDSISAKGSVPMALHPVERFDELLSQIKPVLEHIEYFMEADMHLLSYLWRLFSLALRHREKAGANAISEESLTSVVYKHLLPAASLVPHNPQLSELMWNVMSQLSVFRRYMIYSCWETMYDSFLLKMVYERARNGAKQILKRVVSNADRKDQMSHQAHFHFCKICFSNPIPAMEAMLKDVEIGFNVNMIQPYVECTNRCPDMTADVMGFLLTRMCMKPATSSRPFLNQADATLSSWLVNLGEFVGRFYKKHPHTDLHGLLVNIAKRINSEVMQPAPGSGSGPSEMKGESLIRVILENLIEFMGGYTTVTDMNAEQMNCLAGGPRLRSESISFGKKEDAGRKEKARQKLYEAIAENGLVKVLWYSLSEQRCYYTSEAFSEVNSTASLKLLSMLYDGNHACFLKLTEFLVQACSNEKSREKYASLLPSLEEVFTMLEPSLSFLAIRHGLQPYGRKEKELKAASAASSPPANSGSEPPAASSNGQAGDSHGESGSAAASSSAASAAPQTVLDNDVEELEKVCERQVKEILEVEKGGLSRQFYITFWRLSLQDIFVPSEGYDKALKTLDQHFKANEARRKELERQRDSNHREDKALKKEGSRLSDFHGKLRDEMLVQKMNHFQVMQRIGKEKAKWFLKPSPGATSAFIQHLLHPRLLTSHADMLFCCHFVRLLIKEKTPGFQLLDFYNLWTCMITQCIRCCTEREAIIFGVFIKELMSYIVGLRKSEEGYAEQMKDNPVFYRNYYDKGFDTKDAEWAAYKDIVKGHAKWEGRIHKALKQGLDAEEWMEKRNVLLLLSQSCEAFPLVTKYARVTLDSVEILRDKEELSDLKTLATSLAVKLNNQKRRWFPDEKEQKGRHAGVSEAPLKRDHATSSTGKKNALGSPSGVPQVKSSPEPQTPDVAGSKSDRDRERGSKRSAEQERAASEKRSRREDGEPAADADRGSSKSEGVIVIDKDAKGQHKDHKHSSKDKDSKGEKRESKRPDGEKRTDKEREREKLPAKSASEKDVRESDRKRSSGSQGSTPPPASPRSAPVPVRGDPHDDRGEKRPRRSERDGDGAGHSSSMVDDRLARERQGDRHSSGHSGGSRNALSAESTSGSHHYRRDYAGSDPRADPRSRTSTSSSYPPTSDRRGGYDAHRSRAPAPGGSRR